MRSVAPNIVVDSEHSSCGYLSVTFPEKQIFIVAMGR